MNDNKYYRLQQLTLDIEDILSEVYSLKEENKRLKETIKLLEKDSEVASWYASNASANMIKLAMLLTNDKNKKQHENT